MTPKADRAAFTDPVRGVTDATRAYEGLRRDILFGAFPPGSKLTVESLRARYGLGPIPLREALNRLSAEGFAGQADQRGFFVPPLGLDALAELTRTRCWLHPVLARETLAHGDQAWEEALVVAAHRLAKLRRHQPGGPGLNPDWEAQHRAFHMALIAACPSRWLVKFHAELFDQADRYRHQYLSAERDGGGRDVEAEHRALLEAAVARDVERLTTFLDAHVHRTTDMILAGGADHPPRPAPIGG